MYRFFDLEGYAGWLAKKFQQEVAVFAQQRQVRNVYADIRLETGEVVLRINQQFLQGGKWTSPAGELASFEKAYPFQGWVAFLKGIMDQRGELLEEMDSLLPEKVYRMQNPTLIPFVDVDGKGKVIYAQKGASPLEAPFTRAVAYALVQLIRTREFQRLAGWQSVEMGCCCGDLFLPSVRFKAVSGERMVYPYKVNAKPNEVDITRGVRFEKNRTGWGQRPAF